MRDGRPPRDEYEREVLRLTQERDRHRRGADVCGARGPRGYHCDVELPDGDEETHTGDHVAVCVKDECGPAEIVDRWPVAVAPAAGERGEGEGE